MDQSVGSSAPVTSVTLVSQQPVAVMAQTNNSSAMPQPLSAPPSQTSSSVHIQTPASQTHTGAVHVAPAAPPPPLQGAAIYSGGGNGGVSQQSVSHSPQTAGIISGTLLPRAGTMASPIIPTNTVTPPSQPPTKLVHSVGVGDSPVYQSRPPAGAGAAAAPVHYQQHRQFDSKVEVLSRQRLQELVKQVDPGEQLDEEVEELLLQMADDFIENCVSAACRLAKHRRATSVDVRDVQLYLERNWNMKIPGFGAEEIRAYKRSGTTEAHRQRVAIIRKALKKY